MLRPTSIHIRIYTYNVRTYVPGFNYVCCAGIFKLCSNTECSGSSDVRHLLKDFGEDNLWNVCDELVDNLISEEFAQPDSSIRSTSTLTSSSHFN